MGVLTALGTIFGAITALLGALFYIFNKAPAQTDAQITQDAETKKKLTEQDGYPH